MGGASSDVTVNRDHPSVTHLTARGEWRRGAREAQWSSREEGGALSSTWAELPRLWGGRAGRRDAGAQFPRTGPRRPRVMQEGTEGVATSVTVVEDKYKRESSAEGSFLSLQFST